MKRRREQGAGDGPLFEINTTPLIDVSLVLVVILMVASPLAFESSFGVHKGAPLAQPKAPQLGPAYAALRETLDGLLAATEPRAATAVRVIVRAYSGRILHTTVTRANRPWPQASERLAAHAWPSVQGYESLRHFELFLPD